MATKSTAHSKKTGKTSAPPQLTSKINLTSTGGFQYEGPSVTGYTTPASQLALVAATTIQKDGQVLGKDFEAKLMANFGTVLSARGPSAPTITKESAEFRLSLFENAPDVLIGFMPQSQNQSSTIKVGFASGKINNKHQFEAAVSAGLKGQTPTVGGTLAVMVPTSEGNLSTNLSATYDKSSGSSVSVGVTFSWGSDQKKKK